ncbi:TPA: monooxygenase [Klebsiella aerogenes]|nr:monooxygenase [Klebsiella aerogenes]
MSNKLLQVHFAFSGPFGDEMSTQLAELAQSINQEPGFIWKIWTENRATQEAGGIYLFEDEQSAQAYAKKHAARLRQFCVQEMFYKIFDVNLPLSQINHGPLN